MPTTITTPTDPVSVITATVVADIDAAASVREAAEELAAGEVGALLVRPMAHEAGRAPAGLISERDVVAVVAGGADPETVQVADVMTTDLVTVGPRTAIRTVAEVMLEAGIRHVVVRDDTGPAGIVSVRDVLDALLTAIGHEEES